MWIEGTSIIHAVNTRIGFQNALELRGESANDVWISFFAWWASLYTGYPSVIRLNQAAGFTARAFRDLAATNTIYLQFSGAQAQNAIGSGETYHDPLQTVFKILRSRHPDIGPEIILRYVIKCLNDTMGPNSPVPLLLVYGTMPTFPITNRQTLNQKKQFEVLKSARKEVAHIRAEKWLVQF